MRNSKRDLVDEGWNLVLLSPCCCPTEGSTSADPAQNLASFIPYIVSPYCFCEISQKSLPPIPGCSFQPLNKYYKFHPICSLKGMSASLSAQLLSESGSSSSLPRRGVCQLASLPLVLCPLLFIFHTIVRHLALRL